jgi:ubiquinone biosynthesis protein
MEHYQQYDPEAAKLELATGLMAELDPITRIRVLGALTAGADGLSQLPLDQLLSVLDQLDWHKWRRPVLELVIHESGVLNLVPKGSEDWRPAMHDAMLVFANSLPQERLLARIRDLSRLPPDASRSERLLAFLARTPSLQKLGQILARNPDLDPDIRAGLQTLEDAISTTSRDELVAAIEQELGPETIKEFRIEFADKVLAEASVGAVIKAEFSWPGRTERLEAACKWLKPYAVKNLTVELGIIDKILQVLEAHGEFYKLGQTPLGEMFREVRRALSKEIRVADEQKNLKRAASYYRHSREVHVPELYPFSTDRLTCMEFVRGVKITSAFPDDPRARARLARKLSDVLTYDVLFERRDEALFHGDPHAGNVFHYTADPSNPYAISLIDWGLCATLSHAERARLVQLALGLYLGNRKRLVNNLDVLVEWKDDRVPDPETLEAIVDQVLAKRHELTLTEQLNHLIAVLAKAGHTLRFAPTMFIKAQLTVHGILLDLDPEFSQIDQLKGRIYWQVVREAPMRLLRTIWFPGWNSHDYRSMLSNEDVKDAFVAKLGRGFKKLGKGVWWVISAPVRLFT